MQRIVHSLARRHSLSPQDADDFESLVMMRLIEDDYAVFRKFRGESTLETYLTVVIALLLHEWRVGRWGRWRPSAAARRRGPLAVRLEMLVHRDGHSIDEATELLRTAGHPEVTNSDVRRLLAELPARDPLRPVEVGAASLAGLPADATADAAVLRAEAAAQRASTAEALAAALQRLDPPDRVLVRMRYWEGMRVSEIARALDTAQKPLYRRLEQALATLRAELEHSGLTREQVAELLEEAAR